MDIQRHSTAWTAMSKADIVQHIISEYHCAHRVQLAELLAQSVELGNRVANTGHWPHEFHSILLKLYEDLLEHMLREEQILFPLILSNEFGRLYNEKGLALHNHDHHLHMLDQLAVMSSELAQIEPSGLLDAETQALSSAFRALLSHFSSELRTHIGLENDYLFID